MSIVRGLEAESAFAAAASRRAAHGADRGKHTVGMINLRMSLLVS
jgi:hypothetical protein